MMSDPADPRCQIRRNERLSTSAATTPMTIRAAPESRKPVLTPALSMMVVATMGAGTRGG
jgi:hypothetical protein